MMKKLLSMFALVTMLGFGFTGNTLAEDAAPAAETVTTTEVAPVAEAVAPVACADASAKQR
jgi:Amt family ammonium transporter